MARPKNQRTPRSNMSEDHMVRSIDRLAAFEEFEKLIAPKLRELVKRGASGEEIAKFAESFAAARVASIALLEVDSGKALVAANSILDRVQGKAKERTEHSHKFEKLKDSELDAIILSKIIDSKDN